MKLTFILLTAAALQVSARGYTQKINLSVKDAPLGKVFELITRQTRYEFFYNEEQLQNSRAVTIQIKEADIQEALNICLKDQPFSYTIVNKVIVIKTLKRAERHPSPEGEGKGEAAPIEVKGRVMNEKGESVEGVTVTVKGTKIATSTNQNGEFSLVTVDPDAVLVFTSVNMETFELKVSGKTELAINLKTKVTALGDVQVMANTGYQTVKPNEVNGSIIVIDNRTLNQQVGTNILKRLDGVTSGLLFNIGKNPSNSGSASKTNITIRGLSTINGPLDPLIVLDGFIYEGDINNINPNDIENITILKDAAAASIWGARAGNGVIVITTKKGRFNQKLQVNVYSNIIVNEKPDLFYLPQMPSNDLINVEEFLFNKGFFNNRINTKYQSLTPAVEIFLKRRNGQINATDSATQINALKAIDSRNEYNKYFYTNAVTQQYNINLMGGSNVNAYTFGIGYDKTLGELRNEFRKLNVRVENTFKPVKNFQLNLGIYYTISETLSGMPSYNSIRPGERSATYYRLADDNGNSLSVPTIYRDVYTDTAGAGKLLNWKYYPLEDYNNDKTNTKLQELFSNIGINYKLARFLNVDLKYQYQKQVSQREQLSDQQSFYTRNLINLYSQVNRTNGVVSYIVPLGGIRMLNNASIESQSARSQFNFNHDWSQHSISAILGGEVRQAKGFSDGYTVYGYNADPLTIANVDFVNSYPVIIGGTRGIPGTPSASNTIYRFVSLYGNASYSFRKRYIFSLSGRRDGSNIFGANTNDKWKPLWSVGGSWVISDESFYRSHFLQFLRLRTTYGYSGNVDLTKTAQPVARYVGADRFTNFPFAQIQTLNNPDLRWEKLRQLNLGIDFNLKNNTISGSLEYYLKKGSDLYGETLFDYTTSGISNIVIKNVANMRGNGVDIILNIKNLDKVFKWTTNFLFSYNRSKTTKYYSANAQKANILLGGGSYIIPVVGKDLYGIVAYRWGGLDSLGNPQGFVNGQKSINYNAIVSEASAKQLDGGNIDYIGPGVPKYFGSIINTFTWKQFSLSFNIVYKFQYYFVKPSIIYNALVSSGAGNKDYGKRWQKQGDELLTNVPSFIYPNNTNRDQFYAWSAINVLKGDHLRLQYVNLNYTLSKRNITKAPFNELQLFANAANLGILWRKNKVGLDPDYPSTIRPTKSWAFGIRGNF